MIRQLDETRVSTKASSLAEKFKNRIIGQPKAFEALTRVLEKYQSGIYDRSRPIASLLFLGPTGCGKTGSVEAFVEGLFGAPTHMLKVDCAEFQHGHEIAKLTGSPPGYLGHRETHPFFTNKAIREKFCTYGVVQSGAGTHQVETGVKDPAFAVILLDEIEKASDALWNLLLGIMDRGSLTTGTNEVVDMTPTVIIMTSNVGSSELAVKAGAAGIGFANSSEHDFDYDTMQDVAMSAARAKFTPEFLNRLDDAIVFRSLTPTDLTSILKIEIDKLQTQIVLTSRNVFELEVSPAAAAKILEDGYDKRYNARNLRRVLNRYVSLPLSRLVATGQILDNDVVICDYKDGNWSYFAKTEVKQGFGSPSIPAGRLEVPTLPIDDAPTSAPPDIPKQWWETLPRESFNPLLDMPRKSSLPSFDRRGNKRIE
jgi:ATP-dependent Clp protease ATP-binding subunit ClpB